MSSKQKLSAEEYYPAWLAPDEAEFSHCYATCRCGWQSETVEDPGMADHHRDGHMRYGETPDCSLPTIVLVFADGSTADVV